jgi:hypothetical protein
MKSELEKQLEIALDEIGVIQPWWSEEDRLYVFEHPAYPMVMHGDADCEEARAGYLRALKGFIEERLAGNVAESVERITLGRGGARPGAGRPRKDIPTVAIRIPEDIANWLKADPEKHIAAIRRIIA